MIDKEPIPKRLDLRHTTVAYRILDPDNRQSLISEIYAQLRMLVEPDSNSRYTVDRSSFTVSGRRGKEGIDIFIEEKFGRLHHADFLRGQGVVTDAAVSSDYTMNAAGITSLSVKTHSTIPHLGPTILRYEVTETDRKHCDEFLQYLNLVLRNIREDPTHQ